MIIGPLIGGTKVPVFSMLCTLFPVEDPPDLTFATKAKPRCGASTRSGMAKVGKPQQHSHFSPSFSPAGQTGRR